MHAHMHALPVLAQLLVLNVQNDASIRVQIVTFGRDGNSPCAGPTFRCVILPRDMPFQIVGTAEAPE